MPTFPLRRLRRLRKNPTLRNLLEETSLSIYDFIYPIFVIPGKNQKEEIPSMPGQFRYSIDVLEKEIEKMYQEGVRAILLFGVPEEKDEKGKEAYDPQGIIQKSLRKIKQVVPDMYCITDVCMCEYTSHGHCGILTPEGDIDTEKTLEYLGKIALSHVEAGADMVAPSSMTDGMILKIREELDKNGFSYIPILSYAVKFASSLYAPFREAAESAPSFGDRKGYQLNPANFREALLEAETDIEEGADILMVKPGSFYLDILYELKKRFLLPIAVYHVSGEYAMLKAASIKGWIEEKKVVLELMLSFKRGGADLIISYYTRDLLKWLKEEGG